MQTQGVGEDRPRPPERRRPGGDRAALLVALLLLLALLRPWEPARKDGEVGCRWPRELAARGPWTVAVGCEDRASTRRVRGPARLLFDLPLDLNRADAASLESLPGIGPARAAAIVAARCRAPFADLADLDRVPGIGPRTLAGLAGQVSLGAPVPASESGVGCAPGAGDGAAGSR